MPEYVSVNIRLPSEAQKDHLRELVAALRSGKYVQGRGCLRNNDNQFCCLGVACDVSGQGKWVFAGEEWNYVTHDRDTGKDIYDPAVLPQPLAEYYGMPRGGFTVVDKDEATQHLTNLNDHALLTFSQIADLIEWEYDL